jgi:hypothetical protein
LQTSGVEHALDWPTRRIQLVVTSGGLAGLASVKQGFQPHGVHEVDTAQVEHKFVGASGARLVECVFKDLGRTYVELTSQRKEMPVVLDGVVDAQVTDGLTPRDRWLVTDRHQFDRLRLADETPRAQVTGGPTVGDVQTALQALQTEHRFPSLSPAVALPLWRERKTGVRPSSADLHEIVSARSAARRPGIAD